MAEPHRSQEEMEEEMEDNLLRKIFLVTLSRSEENDSGMVYLDPKADRIYYGGGMDLRLSGVMRLSRDSMETVLSHRVNATSDCLEYFVNSYRRAYDERKKISSLTKDKNLRTDMESVIKYAKSLALGRFSLCIAMSHGGQIGLSKLLSLIFSEVSNSADGYGGSGSTSSSSKELMPPPGFLDDLFRDDIHEHLEIIFSRLYNYIRDKVDSVSALGNFQQLLGAFLLLIRYPAGAKALSDHLAAKKNVKGRSVLDSFFHVSAFGFFKSSPNVGDQGFSESSCLSDDLLPSFSTVKSVMNNLYDGLTEVLTCLLRNTATRENVLLFLGEVINRNASRGRTQVDPLSSASSGMFVNLSVVMLRHSESFRDANLTIRDNIDPKYVANDGHLELRDLTALHASSDVYEWTSRVYNESNQMPHSQASSSGNNGGGAAVHLLKERMSSCLEKPKYSLICECFFMTARVLNLGLLKAFSDYKHLDQDISTSEDTLATLKAMQAQTSSPQLQQKIANVEKDIELHTQERYCYEAQIIRDGGLIKRALCFYRRMVAWLVGLVGGFKIPLPSSIPTEFAAMPEHFVEDTMEILILAARSPKALDGVYLDDFMNFIIMFMATPEYIKNPNLIAKMLDVLCWMPHLSGSSTSTLFGGNQPSLEYPVKNLLKLYIDIELTGSHTQFYDKLNICHNIAELLEFLWQVPSHHKMWRPIVIEEDGVYLNFLNILINDGIYVLDESLNKLLGLKELERELEREMSNTAEWELRPAQERLERTRQFHSQEYGIRNYMKLANKVVSLLALTTKQITAPRLPSETVERLASMLNYFLLQLVGPQRKFSLKDLEKYEFHPKVLLKQFVKIYVHLSRGDVEHIFRAAITKKDGRSCKGELFTAAITVPRIIEDDGGMKEEFINLAEQAKMATTDAMDFDIPDLFFNRIQVLDTSPLR